MTLILIGALLVLSQPATAQNSYDTYSVTVDTTSLMGHPAGPFTAAFVLTDGTGFGDGNNTVTLSNFSFGGGSPSGFPSALSGSAGSMATHVTLTDTLHPVFFLEQFTPGSNLSFTVQLSLQDDSNERPDGL